MIAQVAEAMDYAHRKGIIHRDIKPANIIVTTDGKVKITDFGIAKIASSNLTTTGQFLGHAELHVARAGLGVEVVDGRSDIFSLGVVLYELLTRRKPFSGENLTAISYKIVHEDYPPPPTYDAEIPTEFNPIVARAMAKDPAARFQSGKDFLAALAEFRTRHAEMEMLKDLGEMVAQAENLGPVSTVESKQTPMPVPPPATGAGPKLGPIGLGGGATSLEDLARRGRSDLNPALVGPASTSFDSSIPDWSLDTDALKSPAEREAARKKEQAEAIPSSPGTLISDLQGRKAKKAAAAPPPPTPIFNEENRPTERIQTIPGPPASAASQAAKISTGEIPRPPASAPLPASAIPTPPRGVAPLNGPVTPRVIAPPTPVRGVPPLASNAASAPVTPVRGVPPLRRRRRPRFRRALPRRRSRLSLAPPRPRAAGGRPRRRSRPGEPCRRSVPPRRPRPSPGSGGSPPRGTARGSRPVRTRPTAAPGRAATGGGVAAAGARHHGPHRLAAADGRPADRPGGGREGTLPKSLREALQWDVNKRWAFAVIGAALVVGVVIVGLLLQRSSAIAGREADDAAARQTLERRKLLEDGTRLLGAGQPAEARAKFLELVRLAPESAAARTALQQSELLLAKKQEEERKAAEAGAYLAEARRARAASDWARAVVEAEGALAVDPSSEEAKEIRDAAQAEIRKQSRAAQRKAESQIRALKASAAAETNGAARADGHGRHGRRDAALAGARPARARAPADLVQGPDRSGLRHDPAERRRDLAARLRLRTQVRRREPGGRGRGAVGRGGVQALGHRDRPQRERVPGRPAQRRRGPHARPRRRHAEEAPGFAAVV